MSMDRSNRVTRREFVELSGLAAAGLFLSVASGAGNQARADATEKRRPVRKPDDVLRKLLAGNSRFVSGEPKNPRRKLADFSKLAEGQNPVAVIVGCADSRVPPELLFDQGIGDLFVVRVAGNVISGAGAIVKGSIEYAVAELGVSLIMVLGHAGCGAVKSALQHIDAADALPGAIEELVRSIKPAVTASKGKPGDPLENAIKANVRLGVDRLKSLKPILAGPVLEGKLKVVGGVYDLRTGRVTVIA
jgi:carbonic anhydrase